MSTILTSRTQSKLSAHNGSIGRSKEIIAHSAPGGIVANLKKSVPVCEASSESDVIVRASCMQKCGGGACDSQWIEHNDTVI